MPSPRYLAALAVSLLAAVPASPTSAGAQVRRLDDEVVIPLTRPQIRYVPYISACTAQGCVSTEAYTPRLEHHTTDYFGRTSDVVARMDLRTGEYGGYAATGPGTSGYAASGNYASSVVRWGDFLYVENTAGEARQKRFELFAHATLTGVSASFDAYFELWQLGASSWTLVADRETSLRGPGEDYGVMDLHAWVPPSVGGSGTWYYLFSAVGASVGRYACGPYSPGCSEYGTADGMSTASVYVPDQDGLVTYARGEWLAEQRRPAWAAPQTVAPEPTTLALVAGPLGAAAALRWRRRRGNPA